MKNASWRGSSRSAGFRINGEMDEEFVEPDDQAFALALLLEEDEQLLRKAEKRTESDEELQDRLADLQAAVDADQESITTAVEDAREDTAKQLFDGSDS